MELVPAYENPPVGEKSIGGSRLKGWHILVVAGGAALFYLAATPKMYEPANARPLQVAPIRNELSQDNLSYDGREFGDGTGMDQRTSLFDVSRSQLRSGVGTPGSELQAVPRAIIQPPAVAPPPIRNLMIR